jgi:ADP-ribosylglycohydrolase
MESTPHARLARAMASLEGLSVGDAFGEGFFMSFETAAKLMNSGEFGNPPFDFQDEFILRALIDTRRLDFHAAPWRWTDDTALALEIIAVLRDYGRIEGEALAQAFSARYLHQPARGFGGAMHSLLPILAFGNWQREAQELFDGTGSYGNGAAMRVAPVGAYFADDMEQVVSNAALSSRVTHAHPEGVAGGIAIAVGAALAAQQSGRDALISCAEFLEQVAKWTPESEVRRRIVEAQHLREDFTPEQAADVLGRGQAIAAEDTAPFCLWCVGQTFEHYAGNYEEALWMTVSGLGDRDTTCAIVGGMMGAFSGVEGIPAQWRQSREALGKF